MDLEKLENDLWDVVACIYCNDREEALGIIAEILQKIELEK